MGPRILVRTPNHLGDCLMAIPMINEIREAYPGSAVTVLTPANLAELYEQNPALDGILHIPVEHVHGLMAVMKIREIIEPHHFDIGYIMPPSFGAAAGFKLGSVKERIGYIADGRRLLLTKPLPLPTPLNCQHRAITYFDLLRRSTGQEVEFNRPKLLLNDTDHQRGADILDQNGIKPETPFAVLAFQAVALSRRWGAEQYTALAARLIESRELAILLVGAGADAAAGDEIVKQLPSGSALNLAGKTSIRESAAIMARAAFFVGNDSGPAHLAAAVDTPVVVLSGADDPQETSPLARQKRLIYHSELDCISCVKNKCPLNKERHMKCMTSISVADVLEGVEFVLTETPV